MFVFENADIRNLVKTRLLDLYEIVAFERYGPWNLDQGAHRCAPLVDGLSLLSACALGSLFCDNADCASRDGLIAHIGARADLQCNSLVDQALPC